MEGKFPRERAYLVLGDTLRRCCTSGSPACEHASGTSKQEQSLPWMDTPTSKRQDGVGHKLTKGLLNGKLISLGGKSINFHALPRGA